MHRLLRFVHSRFGGVVPAPGELSPTDQAMLDQAGAAFATVGELIAATRLREGLRQVMGLAQALNRYLDDAAPWKAIKTEPGRAATAVWTALQAVGALHVLTAPFLPFSAQRLHGYLGGAGDVHGLPWAPAAVPAGQLFPPPEPLFRKLEDDELADLLARLASAAPATGEPA